MAKLVLIVAGIILLLILSFEAGRPGEDEEFSRRALEPDESYGVTVEEKEAESWPEPEERGKRILQVAQFFLIILILGGAMRFWYTRRQSAR